MQGLGKKSNIRKHPGCRGPRPDLFKLKKKEAEERQTDYDKLSTEEKICRLDQKFGQEQGAKKEREKLAQKGTKI